MSDNLDYKEAYLTMMRASDRTVRGLELLQQGTSKIMLDIIKAQQAAEELLLNQPTDPASQKSRTRTESSLL